MTPSVSRSAAEQKSLPARSIAALLWLGGFAAVFFSMRLPNHPHVSRLDIWRELPFLLLNMVSQNPDGPETSWSNLSQRFPFLAAGALALFGAWGLGQLILRAMRVPLRAGSCERFVIGCGLGLSGLSLSVLAFGLLAQSVPGAMSRTVLTGFTLFCGALELALIIRGNRQSDPRDQPPGRRPEQIRPVRGSSEPDILSGGQISFGQLGRAAAVTAIALFVVTMVLGAMLPSIDFDVKEYHLGGPKEHFQNGCISFLPHNVYTSFPFLTEMLSLLGMVLCGDWQAGALAGKLILASFGPLTGLAVFATARRCFGELAAWSAALIHMSTPWTYRVSVIAYAEGGLTFYLSAALLAVLLTTDRIRNRRSSDCEEPGRCSSDAAMILLCGLLAGSAMSCKYPGVLQVVIPLGAGLVWVASGPFRRRPAPEVQQQELHAATASSRSPAELLPRQLAATVLLYSAGVCITVGPWLLKNTCETGNPVYPLLQSVFHGSDWTPELETNWKRAHSPDGHELSDLFVKLSDVTVRSDWLSPLLFSLAPLSFLLAGSRRAVAGLWLYVAFLFLSWWLFTHRIDRFWIPLIPVVSILAGAGLTWTREKIWQIASVGMVAACVVFNLGFVSTPLCGLNHWLGNLPEVQEVAAQASCPGIARLNQLLPATRVRILMVGEAQIFDAQFPLLYNTVFDISIFEAWCSADTPGVPPAEQPLKPADEIHRKLLEQGITHIYVNWQEVLRYRMTYGYSAFVAPHRFTALSRDGIFADSPLAITDPIDIASMSHQEQVDLRRWAPELIGTFEGREYFVPAQLYTVRR